MCLWASKVSTREEELKPTIILTSLISLLLAPDALAGKLDGMEGQASGVQSVPSSILGELESQTESHEQSEAGYEDTGFRVQGMLVAGAESWQTLTLDEGTYRVVGTCSNSCLDVNLQLWSGEVNVYEDMLDDDFPYLDFSVDEITEYRVKSIMASCDSGGQACGYQMSVWKEVEVEEPDLAEQLTNQTDSHSESMNENGWERLKGLESVGEAASSESVMVDLTFPTAGEYRVMAVCSNECGNVDLEIQEAGDRLGSDTFQDDFPFVTFTAQDVNVTALVTMVQCSAENCGYELSVWGR
tara:strand:+ start:133 stop:1029 length:897 start_codon:yes stop_codon:yes gene_type:complete